MCEDQNPDTVSLGTKTIQSMVMDVFAAVLGLAAKPSALDTDGEHEQ